MFLFLSTVIKKSNELYDLISPTASRSQKIYLREFMIEDNLSLSQSIKTKS
jgi:hypothetical protein